MLTAGWTYSKQDMGILRWLDRIDPVAWEKASRSMSTPPRSPEQLSKFLAAFGKPADQSILERFQEADDPLVRMAVLNNAFESAITAESWPLDKALGQRGLGPLPKLLPALSALRLIIDFEGIDTHLPEACGSVDSGLFGCLSPQPTQACARAIAAFQSIGAVCEALKNAKPSLVRRLFGGGSQMAALAAELDNDYFRDHWNSLRAAIGETASRGHLLGLGMSM
jgi:hypothetical protein